MSPAQAGGVTVVIPTYNEAESIGAVLAEVPRDVVSRILVIDGGSGDGTQERARAAGAEVIAVGRGYGLACLAGAQAAQPDDIVVFMDGDGADDPSAIAAVIAPIRRGDCDFVITSRALGPREPGSMAAHQLLAGRAAGVRRRVRHQRLAEALVSGAGRDLAQRLLRGVAERVILVAALRERGDAARQRAAIGGEIHHCPGSPAH